MGERDEEIEERGERERERIGRGDRENIEQKQQDPGRALERVLNPAALPGPRRVEVGRAGTLQSAVKRWKGWGYRGFLDRSIHEIHVGQ